jgi:YegS/Rv2252/BmrU family lipid kinase
MKPHLIVNPASANGRTGRHLDAIVRAVRDAVGEFECSFTRRRGDGSVLAREATRAGANLVVAVGGDGTASEVIDGLARGGEPLRPEVTFGFIPRGTGSDFRRTLAWPSDPGEAAQILSVGAEREIDLGLIEFTGHDGRAQVRHFANVAGFGISGRVVREVERGGKALGGKVSFMIASARVLAGWRDQPVRWRADGGPWREERVTALSVCNGRYFGGGMMVAPAARVDDGLLDVTVWRRIGLSDFILRKSMLYDGTHVRLPNTQTLRVRTVEAEPLGGETVLLDVDGEQPGTLPARFTVVPGALRARVPAPIDA